MVLSGDSVRVAIVILNWNGWKDTVECLASLFQLNGVDCRVIVCDNASRDDSLDYIREWVDENLPSVKTCRLTRSEVIDGVMIPDGVRLAIVDNGANLGFAGGNNVGIKLALSDTGCRYVWVLNNDTVVDPHSLSEAVSHAEEDARIGICGSSLLYYHSRSQVQAFGGAVYSRLSGRSRHIGAFSDSRALPQCGAEVERVMSYVVGAAMLVRREFIEQVGLMCEDYFLYFEENDWATRGRGRFRLGYAPKSVVFHKEGASIGTDASGGSPLSLYFLYRNRVRFSAHFYPFYVPLVFICCLFDVAKFVLKARWAKAAAALGGLLQLPRTSFLTLK